MQTNVFEISLQWPHYDQSRAASKSEAEIDPRVRDVRDIEYPDLICDLPVDDNDRPEQFSIFFETSKNIDNIKANTERVVDDCRHD